MIQISVLTKPTGPGDSLSYFHTDESDFYYAYSAHLTAAKALATQNLFVDAIYHLNFSTECFFKYTFCLVRKQHLGITSATALASWLTGWTQKNPFRQYLHAKNFSHDLSKMRIFLESETDIATLPEFSNLITYLPTKEDWVFDRYKPRKNSTHQQRYKDYELAFESLINALAGIK